VFTGLGSLVTLWNHPYGFIALVLRGDIIVETWNNNVYGWVECPWYASSWRFISLKIDCLGHVFIYLYIYLLCVLINISENVHFLCA
jgi:hypothetical protein